MPHSKVDIESKEKYAKREGENIFSDKSYFSQKINDLLGTARLIGANSFDSLFEIKISWEFLVFVNRLPTSFNVTHFN